MSAFLNAYYNINNIDIDDNLKPLFKKMMLLYHENDKHVGLSRSFNVKDYFEKHLFLNTFPDMDKIKITTELSEYSEDAEGANGLYIPDTNRIEIYIDRINTIENYNLKGEDAALKVLSHEFVHFLTLFGNITINASKAVSAEIPHEYIMVNVDKNDYLHYVRDASFCEALTEITAQLLIDKNSFHAYDEQVRLINIVNELFNINKFVGFFERHMYDYKDKAPGFLEMFLESNNSLLDFTLPESESSLEEILQSNIYNIIEIFTHSFNLTKHTMSDVALLNQLYKVYKVIPYKHHLKNVRGYNKFLETVTEHYMEKHNITYNKHNKDEVTKLLRKHVAIRERQELSKQQGFNNTIIAKFKNQFLGFGYKDNEIYMFDYNLYQNANAFNTMKLISSDKPESDKVNIVKSNDMKTLHPHKQKGKDNPYILNIYHDEFVYDEFDEIVYDENDKPLIDRILLTNEPKFMVNDSKLTLIGKNKTQTFEMNQDISKLANSFERDLHQTIKSIKQLEKARQEMLDNNQTSVMVL